MTQPGHWQSSLGTGCLLHAACPPLLPFQQRQPVRMPGGCSQEKQQCGESIFRRWDVIVGNWKHCQAICHHFYKCFLLGSFIILAEIHRPTEQPPTVFLSSMESVLFCGCGGGRRALWVGRPSRQEYAGMGGEGSGFRGLRTVGQGVVWS